VCVRLLYSFPSYQIAAPRAKLTNGSTRIPQLLATSSGVTVTIMQTNRKIVCNYKHAENDNKRRKYVHKGKKVRYYPYGKAQTLVIANIFLLQKLASEYLGPFSSIIFHAVHFTNSYINILCLWSL
jgi:hypothetical protein